LYTGIISPEFYCECRRFISSYVDWGNPHCATAKGNLGYIHKDLLNFIKFAKVGDCGVRRGATDDQVRRYKEQARDLLGELHEMERVLEALSNLRPEAFQSVDATASSLIVARRFEAAKKKCNNGADAARQLRALGIVA
jgi:hypothetical protein